jgi:hypothetical protein
LSRELPEKLLETWNNSVEKELKHLDSEGYPMGNFPDNRSEHELLSKSQLLSQWTTTRHFLQSLKVKPSSKPHFQGYHITSVFAKTLVPARQGPYKFQPAPKELGTDGIWTSTSGIFDFWISQSEPAWMALVFGEGKIHLLIELDLIGPRWVRDNIREDELPLPCLTTVETIELGLSTIHVDRPSSSNALSSPIIHCISDDFYEETMYIAHKQGIHSVTCPWLGTLKAIVNLTTSPSIFSEEMLLQEKLFNLPPTQLRFLLDTAAPENHRTSSGCSPTRIKTVLNLTEPYVGYGLLVLLESNRLISIELPFQSNIIESLMSRHRSEVKRTLFSPLKEAPFEDTTKSYADQSTQDHLRIGASSYVPAITLPSDKPWTNQFYPHFINEESLDVILSHVARLRSDYLRHLMQWSREMGDR